MRITIAVANNIPRVSCGEKMDVFEIVAVSHGSPYKIVTIKSLTFAEQVLTKFG
jgi:hypothetical protein